MWVLAGLDGSLYNDVWSLQLPGDWRPEGEGEFLGEIQFCCSALIGFEACDEGTGPSHSLAERQAC